MNLSISNIAWSAENDNEMYRFLHDTGFQGLEIAPTRVFSQAPYENISKARIWAENLREKYSLVIPSNPFGLAILKRYLARKKSEKSSSNTPKKPLILQKQ